MGFDIADGSIKLSSYGLRWWESRKKIKFVESEMLIFGRKGNSSQVCSSRHSHIFPSCFKCPKAVVRRIELIQCNFLWNDTCEKQKYHLVKLCSSLHTDCGLGIQSNSAVNKGMLRKWLWHMGDNSQGLWRCLMMDKYMLATLVGWFLMLITGPLACASQSYM